MKQFMIFSFYFFLLNDRNILKISYMLISNFIIKETIVLTQHQSTFNSIYFRIQSIKHLMFHLEEKKRKKQIVTFEFNKYLKTDFWYYFLIFVIL